MRLESPEDLEDLRKSLIKRLVPNKPCIVISTKATCCYLRGSEKVVEAIKGEIRKQNLEAKVEVRTTGCMGFCEVEPIMVIHPEGIFYPRVKPENTKEIVSETIKKKVVLDRLLYVDPTTGERIKYENDIPFYKGQQRIISGNNSLIDPESIDDYIAIGGYSALSKALFQMEPDNIISEVISSGLRGRGGGGFPTGWKWESCKDAVKSNQLSVISNQTGNQGLKTESCEAYVICNADEGDPGAYMDRSLLEGNPHSILEGMIIGAYAIGSHKGYIYVRNEYPLAVKHLSNALAQARAYGL